MLQVFRSFDGSEILLIAATSILVASITFLLWADRLDLPVSRIEERRLLWSKNIGVHWMFGNKRRAAIKQRAKLMGRMVMLLTDDLCAKSYDQFVDSYSNPGDEPDETARDARISRFEMRFSPTCWYEATASLAENTQPWIYIEGGGDDCGVFINVRVPADANEPSCPVVDLHVPRGAKRGHDAGAMVRALRDIPGWRWVSTIWVACVHELFR